ncbi:hypothetical protein PR048_023847 [Dryococelus australis]|uniref:Glucosylceramidase n=1 Tax=Dryococelus australis TaxID=614101 RepID=A0ABQ9GVA3_9NEOP|nr:hypothetical protein PR048_023847 [Dryococelus australis]
MFKTGNWIIVFCLFPASCSADKCVSRDYGHGSTVCVCNSTYCDTVEPTTVDQISGGYVRHYVTSKAGKRLQPMTMKFSSTSDKKSTSNTFKVNHNTRYQKMLGFGGAATDANGLNTYSLTSKAAENLIRSYFAKDGIGYTFIRVPVAGSDFSTHNYEYTDNHPNDTTLKYFNLTMEDFSYKVSCIFTDVLEHNIIVRKQCQKLKITEYHVLQ